MSIPMIETGYKPQFSLGALYQGFNAGSADNAAQLANLAKEWELQKSRAEDPYKVLSSMYQGELDNARNNPNSIGWKVAGETGDSMSKYTKGRIDFETLEPSIKNKLVELENQGIDLESLGIFKKERNKNIKAIQDGTGVIGFPTQEQEQPTGNVGFNFAPQSGGVSNFPQGTAEPTGGMGFFREALKPAGMIGPLKNEAAMKASMGTDYRSGNPGYDETTTNARLQQTTPAAYSAEKARLLAEGAGQTQVLPSGIQPGGGTMGAPPVFSNMQTQAAPTTGKWGDLLPRTGNLARMAGTMAITPETVSEMAKTEMNNDNRLAAAEARARQAESGIDARNDKADRAALSTDYRTNETAISRQSDELRKYLSGAVAQENFEKLVEGKNYNPEQRAKLKSEVDAAVAREVARIKTDITNLRNINDHILKKMYPNYGNQPAAPMQNNQPPASASTGVTPSGNTYRKTQN
jgi:hypothetical protein